MSRILQDIKTHQPYRPPAPQWLKVAYLASIATVLYSAGLVGKTVFDLRQAEEQMKRDRTELAQAQADVAKFSELFKTYESSQKIDRSRREWRNSCPPSANIQLAILRAVQDTSRSQRGKKDDASLQVKSMVVVWQPKTKDNPPLAKLDLMLSCQAGNEEKAIIQREFMNELGRWSEQVSLFVTSPKWGAAAGGLMTLSVELRQEGL